MRQRHGIAGVQLAICRGSEPQTVCIGESGPGGEAIAADTLFEIASLSKTVASAFALEFFAARGIPLSSSVNALFQAAGADFRLTSTGDPAWADAVTIAHLMNHQALNRHYVHGVPADHALPPIADIVRSSAPGRQGSDPGHQRPGSRFQYSGGGFWC